MLFKDFWINFEFHVHLALAGCLDISGHNYTYLVGVFLGIFNT
jgi:hypothetical protein